jgi:hypothetical protein
MDNEGGDGPQIPPDRVAVLAIAYHNLAVQQEFLAMWTHALGTTFCCLLSSACCLLSSACCLLSAVCCLLFAG